MMVCYRALHLSGPVPLVLVLSIQSINFMVLAGELLEIFWFQSGPVTNLKNIQVPFPVRLEILQLWSGLGKDGYSPGIRLSYIMYLSLMLHQGMALL